MSQFSLRRQIMTTASAVWAPSSRTPQTWPRAATGATAQSSPTPPLPPTLLTPPLSPPPPQFQTPTNTKKICSGDILTMLPKLTRASPRTASQMERAEALCLTLSSVLNPQVRRWCAPPRRGSPRPQTTSPSASPTPPAPSSAAAQSPSSLRPRTQPGDTRTLCSQLTRGRCSPCSLAPPGPAPASVTTCPAQHLQLQPSSILKSSDLSQCCLFQRNIPLFTGIKLHFHKYLLQAYFPWFLTQVTVCFDSSYLYICVLVKSK